MFQLMRQNFLFMRILFCIVSLLFLTIKNVTAAEDLKFRAGEYILRGGNGILSLKLVKEGNFTFSIHTDWANGHMCELGGKILKGRAVIPSIEGNKPCVVNFLVGPDGIEVQDDHEVCGYYCGARAGIAGLYLRPVAGCSRQEVSKTRAEFKRLYANKNYEKAETVITPLISSCLSTIDFVNSAWIRNDLAITQYKLGKLSECRSTLEPLVSDASTYDGANVDDPDVLPEIRPLFPVMKATLANFRLCKGKLE
jgi:hypothetical protein